MLMIEQPVRLTGIGYEGCDLDEFIRRLRREGVSLLVDVRLNPISRKRGFSKTALKNALADAGIAYEHMRELGNPKWNRAGFGGGAADLRTARGVYAERLLDTGALECLDRIADSARWQVVAVMCFEADQYRCHRDLVIEGVRERLRSAVSA
ncbi:DUF488 domain-containing protein [Sphaerimonospora thailandensis]|uniref:DUF488 domain-containing protein n=1 Tax=Sphaerimonospora thailandensis TaxID=795644 RepID=A0A8J3R7H6_9ACTN|nr:DUF488 domain-containing protein [Sphaerimonospora thailandensis]GIH69790.1 hypothetical protein Mth01_20430 [Sphaerimonospora thailandensis]